MKITKQSSIITLLAASLALPSAARAQDEKEDSKDLSGRAGYYFSFAGGLAEAADDLVIPGAAVSGGFVFPQNSISLQSGYSAIGAIGVYEGFMRGEMEFSYRNNDVSHVTSTTAITSSGGNVAAFSIMANGYGDLPITKRISAYLGGGLGLAFLDMNVNATQIGGASYRIDGNPTAFAVQGMIGLNIKIARRLTVTGGFRAWTAYGMDATFVSTGGGTIVHAQSNHHFDMPVIYGPEVGLRLDF